MNPTCEIDEYGNKCWYLNGKVHREDGPAIEYAKGSDFWFLEGKLYTQEDFTIELRKRKLQAI
jgi:hypothetical protein